MKFSLSVCLLFVFFVASNTFSQSERALDSLITLNKKHTKEDTTKIDLLLKIAMKYALLDTLKANEYSNEAFRIAKKVNDNKFFGNCMNNFGRNCYFRSQFKKAEMYFKNAIPYFEKAEYYKGLGSVYNNLGAIKNAFGETHKAIEYQKKSLEINQKINNEEAIANNLTNIGNCYNSIGEYKLAMEHFLKAEGIYEKLKIWESLSIVYQNLCKVHFQLKQFPKARQYAVKNLDLRNGKAKSISGLAYAYILMATISFEEKNNKEAKAYYNKAILYGKDIGDPLSLAYAYLNYAKIYNAENNFDSALVMSEEALVLSKAANANEVVAECYLLTGQTKIKLLKYADALKDLEAGYQISKEIKNIVSIADLSYGLSTAQYELGDYKKAYDNLFVYAKTKDTLLNNENIKLISDLEAKYQAEKKDLQIKNQSLEITAKQKENDAKNRLLVLGSIAIVAIAIFGFIAFRNFLKVKKSNVIIQEQKHQVEIQKEEISVQKELVEVKQKEIIDSINYAKRIQTAVLTGDDIWDKISKEHFILFKPKDIVSGDFYWAYNTPNGRAVFALADCTGHGVPGGFMSMLGNSFLNEIVVDNKIFKANEILNKLRQKIITALDQEGHGEQKDGMDISLCVWNKLDNTLEFAGANNPLWILKKSVSSSLVENKESSRDVELVEYKADKMPIGSYTENVVPFKSETIQLEKGDIIYLITDGFADQFGGPKGKKFKYRPLMDLLVQHSDAPMIEQKMVLEKAIEQWKEGYEQVDDVSLIGVRV